MKRCSNARLSTLIDDPYLSPYLEDIRRRQEYVRKVEFRLTGGRVSIADFASGHEYYGLHRSEGGWVFREWAPNADAVYLIGSFTDWQEKSQFRLQRIDGQGVWELILPEGLIHHKDLYRLRIYWQGGEGERIPAYARRVVQDEKTKIFNAHVWSPRQPFEWRYRFRAGREFPLIYEAHIGMAQEHEGVGTYDEFRRSILPRIRDAGYDTIQMMGLMEHPYYGSFGYHVSSFFAASSRFGTPEELKALIDEAHGMGLAVVMDLVHSHAVKNEVEGLSRFDGTLYQYFHEGERGFHPAWDSRCFDYGKPEVLHFLLSNCRFWLDEYRVDGFRFDGITSMLYLHHGLGHAFTSYEEYFGQSVDEDAIAYLVLANRVIHEVRPDAVTIAEDVSGMPGIASPLKDGGCGFDYRLAMGVPDCWFKLVNDVPDENWDLSYLWHELANRRSDEKTISYAESHDQALVGGKSLIFEMVDAEMYDSMHVSSENLVADRGIALHKMIRLATIATAGNGYLNFMGNEFGHPEWVDFPREGNNWSYHYARRQWHLRDDPDLKYHLLGDFDRAMLDIIKESKGFEWSDLRLLLLRNDEKILIFERGGLFFFFNFDPVRSVSDYSVNLIPGEYVLVIDTDEGRFGGHSRLTPSQRYFTRPVEEHNTLHHCLQVYLPCRTALVLRRQSG
ncbi:MAG: alpha amylase C-terminal domain-containing protein [Deltaproteobacteria bacterium]|nr:alpha amylase C-terminal domain-containing protein [Deltaproteobacteria bacterium]